MHLTAMVLLLAAAVQPAPPAPIVRTPPVAGSRVPEFTFPTQDPPTELSAHGAGWRYGATPFPRMTHDVVGFVPGPVRCGTDMVVPDRVVTPYDTSTIRYAPPPGAPPGLARTGFLSPPSPNPRMFDFAIDAAGNPTAIRLRVGPLENGGYVDTSDLAPALAA